ncbi:MAG: MauE/DoxX family redox-associated membrane protein [Jatrophihabitantaceae bacterium]
MQYLSIACRTAVALVFLLSVTGKIIGSDAFGEFTRSIDSMRILPLRYVRSTALSVVVSEGATCVLTVAPAQALAVAGCALAAALSVSFVMSIVQALRHGHRAPCRCFGRSTRPLGAPHIGRNLILLGISVAGLISTLGHRASVDSQSALVAIAAGLVLGLCIAATDDLANLLSPNQSDTSQVIRRNGG